MVARGSLKTTTKVPVKRGILIRYGICQFYGIRRQFFNCFFPFSCLTTMLHPFMMQLNKRSVSGSYINFSRIYRMFEINLKEIIGVVFNGTLSTRNFVLI